MKKKNAFLPIMALMLVICLLNSCQSEKEIPTVGVLTAYYAKEDFNTEMREYKKGELICDSNDPINRIVDENEDYYKYEGDDTGEDYSWLIPKLNVEKKVYTMNQLTASDIGNKAVFVADNGSVARIFWSNINGHGFFNWNGEEEKYRDEERYKECYVLSVEYISPYDNKKHIMFEEQLQERQGCIELYKRNPYAGENSDTTNCRYRENPIGFIDELWLPKEGWGYDKTSYDENGKLLVDQWEEEGIPIYISIAYIADLNALYVDGQLYYRINDEDIKISSGIEEHEDVMTTENCQEQPQAQQNPDVQHFVGNYIYSHYLGDTNSRLYFKLSLKSDGSFTLEPNNEETKNWIDMEIVVDGKDYPDGGSWVVKDVPGGKGAFLDFDGSWGDGTITYDRTVLEINNMNGYKLKTELLFEAP